MVAPGKFSRVVLQKLKLNNLIKREVYILITKKYLSIIFWVGDESWVHDFCIKYLSIILANK